jgi:hypothetical protein
LRVRLETGKLWFSPQALNCSCAGLDC